MGSAENYVSPRSPSRDSSSVAVPSPSGDSPTIPSEGVVVWANEFGFVQLDPEAKCPTKAHQSDAGYDLYALDEEWIPSGAWRTLSTGVGVQLPTGFVGFCCPRSGLAAREGVTVHNAPGIIDTGFTGEIKVILHNIGPRKHIRPGDKIAQLVVVEFFSGHPRWVERKGTTDRGAAGFGSTG